MRDRLSTKTGKVWLIGVIAERPESTQRQQIFSAGCLLCSKIKSYRQKAASSFGENKVYKAGFRSRKNNFMVTAGASDSRTVRNFTCVIPATKTGLDIVP